MTLSRLIALMEGRCHRWNVRHPPPGIEPLPMNPTRYLLLALALIALSVRIGSAETAEPPKPPNIVLILADDQGYGDVGFHGNAVLKTPHLDQLAAEGTRFSSFYVSPVCAPTRASLLTGRYHARTGVLGVIEGREFMVEDEVTVAEHLSEAGYSTAIYGKWHLGENYPWVPHAQGFDEFIGFRDGSHPYFDVELEKNGESLQTEGYLTDVLTDRAIDFVVRHQEQPFFLYLPYNAPHTPLQVPDHYVAPYRHLPETTARIYGMMASVDANVGRLLEQLDTLGLDENTLVIYLSDNGPIFPRWQGASGEPRFNAGLRGAKYSVYEGGIRVPAIFRWPGRIEADRIVDDPAAHIDLLPTLLDYAGIPVPPQPEIDGRSLRPVLDGLEGAPDPRTLFMWYAGERRATYADPEPYPGGMARRGQFKMVNGTELYDLLDDPGESNNLADFRPELLRDLDQAYRAFWREVTGDREPYPRIPIGHSEENPTVLTAHWAHLSGGLRFQIGDEPPRYRDVGVHGDAIALWESGGRAKWKLQVAETGEYRFTARVRWPDDAYPPIFQSEVVADGATDVDSWGSDWDPEKRNVVLGHYSLKTGPADLVLSLPDGGEGVVLESIRVERR